MIVLILPYYETRDSVRHILSGDSADQDATRIDVTKYEKDQSLIIIDAARAYFGSSLDIRSFINSLINYAEKIGKNGVCALCDMGAFFQYSGVDELIAHEASFPPKFNITLKAFCLYHNHNSDYARLTEDQKRELLENHHGKELLVTG
jgi:hypothetical protein